MSPATAAPIPVPSGLPTLVQRLLGLGQRGRRTLVGLCGAPGAGKSTLASLLAGRLEAAGGREPVVVPLDGFHLAASVIASDDRATRRGAPDTFDALGYALLMERIAADGAGVVFAPEYRRDIEDPVAAAIAVPPSCRFVITEGNYLLDEEPPWPRARAVLDEVWYVRAVDEPTRLDRLVARHLEFGKDHAAAWAHAAGSDQRNAERVAARRGEADLVIVWES